MSSAELSEWEAYDFVGWEDAEKGRLQAEANREVEAMKRDRRR